MCFSYKNGKRINVTTLALKDCIGVYKRHRICSDLVRVLSQNLMIILILLFFNLPRSVLNTKLIFERNSAVSSTTIRSEVKWARRSNMSGSPILRVGNNCIFFGWRTWTFVSSTDEAECELNCRPVNQRYFARLKEYVIDGTTCTKPHITPKNSSLVMKNICVDGICKVCTIIII